MSSAVSLPNHTFTFRLSPLSGKPVLCTFFRQKKFRVLRRRSAKKISKIVAMATILNFSILTLFYLKVISMLSIKLLETNGLLVQEKKRKIDFEDGGHLGFPI